MNINFNRPPRSPKGILAQLFTVVVGAILLGAAFMFSLVFFAVLAISGVILWLYFWWKTRALRQQMRDQPPLSPADFVRPTENTPTSGEIIEGEATRVPEAHRQLPR